MITEIFERVRWVTGALAVNEVNPETNGVKTHVVDTFLTDVSTLPNTTQNKLLQEKITLLHQKLANTIEVMQSFE